MQCMRKLDSFVNSIQIEESDEPFVEANLPLSPEADPDYGEDEKVNLAALEKIEGRWAKIIKKFPQILKNSFKSEPIHKVYHKIEMVDDKPIKAKVRPLLASSEKSIQGRRTWEEMEKMGVIERVHPSTLTDYSSALHLVKNLLEKVGEFA